ncbi:MAG TPA: hypothetical protein VGF18_04960 [Candidatus Tumulicola sp.]
MNEQFPNDEVGGKQRAIVHILSVSAEPDQSHRLASDATALLRDLGPSLEGFIEGRVFEDDGGKSVTVMTTWQTRHLWAKAVWNQRVDGLLESVDRHQKLFDAVCYEISAFAPNRSRNA